MTNGYVYLASPYSHPDPEVRRARYEAVEGCLHWLLMQRTWAYAPIVHLHHLALRHELPFTFEFYNDYNQTMIRGARRMMLLCLPGWRDSRGCTNEREFCATIDRPVDELHPLAAGGYRLVSDFT